MDEESVDMAVGESLVKKYHVNANQTRYFSESFDTQEEALAVVARLIEEGYAFVGIRDNEQDGDDW